MQTNATITEDIPIPNLTFHYCVLEPFFLQLYFLFQKCYEHKQYKNGLKFAKQILSNPKFTEHGGKEKL